MDLTTILGVIVGFIAVIGAMIFKKISFAVLLNPAAFFVIFVGTVATILNSFPSKNLKSIGALFKILFTKQKDITELEIIKLMVDLATVARKEGLLVLEKRIDSIDDYFTKKGVRMVIDGLPEEFIESTLNTEIENMETRHNENASIFSSAGTYAPTLGVLGAVFGLISAMSHINEIEIMAEAVAGAFIATILGIFTGYVLWNPFAKKLKVKTKEEVLRKQLIVEGILSIQKGESPIMIKEKLLSFIPQSKQEKIVEALV